MAGSSSRGDKRKCPRVLEKDTTVCLCDLPDAILIHILSFLPTKLLVSTSSLSRRWRYLWTSTPNLQLHDYDFKYDQDKFMTFAERAMVLRAGSSLVSFSLSCWLKNDESRINTWITSAIQHNVEQLSLSLWGYKTSFVLPSCIFGCQSLVKLKLDMICIRVPSMIRIPLLKHLALKKAEFADKESAEKLLSHPMLEELILCNCDWINVKTAVNVNSPKLQSLEIEDKYKDWSEERLVCVLGDKLKSFRYKGDTPPTQYCICGSTMQLREAEVLVRIPNHDVLDMDVASKRYLKLVNSLSRVQNLTLSDETAKSLYLLSQRPGLQTTIPVFKRVTRLNLSACNDPTTISIDSTWLKMIFKRCPHLKHLNFMKVVVLVFESLTEKLPLLMPMPSCFRTHLKKITLQRCYPERDEQANAIHVLLNSAPVLEEMVVHCKWDTPTGTSLSGFYAKHAKNVKLEDELNTRPKASQNCRVFARFLLL